MPIADDLRDRAVQLVRRTREADDIEFGASPRASMALVQTAKARASSTAVAVTGEDIEALAAPVLRHRIIVDFRAEREGRTADDLIAARWNERLSDSQSCVRHSKKEERTARRSNWTFWTNSAGSAR